jgi:hypothetical protein
MQARFLAAQTVGANLKSPPHPYLSVRLEDDP